MSQSADEMVLEVANRTWTQIRYPHACAFLDGHPEPTRIEDIERLIRLMAYDIICEHGSRGTDPAEIYAVALALVHAIKGQKKSNWEWGWRDLRFRSTPCNQVRFAKGDSLAGMDARGVFHSLVEWRNKLEQEKIADWPGSFYLHGKLSYPEPDEAILHACLIAITAAQEILGPKRVSVWLDQSPQECVLLELWNQKTSKVAYCER